jgi:hypothetical protein
MHRDVGHDAARARALEDHVVFVSAVVEADRELVLVGPDLVEIHVVPRAEYRAAAADVEEPLQGAGIDVGVTGEKVERAIAGIKRNAVTGAENLDFARMLGIGHVLCRLRM